MKQKTKNKIALVKLETETMTMMSMERTKEYAKKNGKSLGSTVIKS